MLRQAKARTPYFNLEDHTSIETSHNGQGRFDPLIDIGHRKVAPKACVLRELERTTFSKVPGSTDHLNHCTRLSHYTKTSTDSDILSGLLSIGDPAATVVQCKGQFFLAIIQINNILFDTSLVLKISP